MKNTDLFEFMCMPYFLLLEILFYKTNMQINYQREEKKKIEKQNGKKNIKNNR